MSDERLEARVEKKHAPDMGEKPKIYKDLVVWQKSLTLVEFVYQLMPRAVPLASRP